MLLHCRVLRLSVGPFNAGLCSSLRPSVIRSYRSAAGRLQKQQEELFPQRIALPENRGYVPMLSPLQVTSILTLNEASSTDKFPSKGPIRYFNSNQLPSNNPIEDRRAVGQLLQTGGTLFGVFDGHGGAACAQAVSERLFDYVAITILPYDALEEYSHYMRTNTPLPILDLYRFRNDYVSDDLVHLYQQSLQKYVVETLSVSGLEDTEGQFSSIVDQLKSSFLRLDEDISSEAMPVSGTWNEDAISIALSGSCACVVHVKDLDVHAASVGDCRAVIGRTGPDGGWIAHPLTVDHNTENPKESQRVKNSHPKSETSMLFKNSRLLSQLIPLRAFGDVRFKWSAKDLKSLSNLLGPAYADIIPNHYHTPPYLIARPEVTNYRLKKNDRFLVVASDGLWETMPNEKVVEIVGDHFNGKKTLDEFASENFGALKLGEINNVLQDRRRGMAHRTTDDNGATHLMRHALGYEHRKVSEMLTFPPQISRFYRDDITITIVYFDDAYLAENAED